MPVSRRSEAPAGLLNASGEPEIELEINGLVLSMKPPAADAPSSEPEAGADLRK